MKWDDTVLFEINDLYDYEPEAIAEFEHIDRRSAVKDIIGGRIKRHFADIDDGNILSEIENPDVLNEPAVLLDLYLVFQANATGGIYREKAAEYEARFERSISRALELIEFDGLESTGVTLVR